MTIQQEKTAIFLVGKNPKFLSFYDFQLLVKVQFMRLIAIVHQAVWLSFPETVKRFFSKIYIAKISSNDLGILNESEVFEMMKDEITQFPDRDLRIFPMSEYNVLLAALLREAFQIPGATLLEVMPFRNKKQMNQLAKALDIRVPEQIFFDKNSFDQNPNLYFKKLSASFKLPFIVKPVDAAGGRGVLKISNYKTFEKIDFSSWHAESTWVIEEYIQGALFHVDMIFYSGELVLLYCGEYNLPLLEFQSNKNVGSIVLPPEFEFCKKLSDFAKSTFKVLPCIDGLIHAEFFYDANSESFIFLEAAARPGGGHIIPMYQKTFGINLLNLDFYAQFGLPDLLSRAIQKRCASKQYAAWCFIPERAGVLSHKHYPSIQSHYEMTWMFELGDIMIQPRSLMDKAGSLFLWSSNYFELKYELMNLAATELICVS